MSTYGFRIPGPPPVPPGSIYSFRIPGPPVITPSPTPTGGGAITTRSPLGGLFDQLIDPATRDYVRTDNGEWAETPTSESIVLIMFESELGASPFFPSDGTRIKALLREGDPVTPEMILAETLRALQVLVADGVITDVHAEIRDADGNVFQDEAGRMVVRVRWRDLAAGSPVDLVLQLGS
jgi:hypothetical protein